MEYHIFCKQTHKLLAVYKNPETLKNLDLSKCYYREVENNINKQLNQNKNGLTGKNTDESKSSQNDDYMNPLNSLNPLNPIYHSIISDSYQSHSISCNQSSNSYSESSYSSSDSGSYSDSSSSSSSCDY